MKRTTIITLIAALMMGGAAAAGPGMSRAGGCDFDGPHQFGRRGGPGMHGGPGQHGPGPGMLLNLSDELELTDDQVDRLESLQTQFGKEMVDKRAAVQKARIELRSLMRDKAATSQVDAAIDKVTQLRAENMKARYRHREQVESVLTDEQLDQLKNMRQMGPRDGDGPRGKRRGDCDGSRRGSGSYGCYWNNE